MTNRRLRTVALVAFLFALGPTRTRADRIDDLTRALMQDPSYKVRVQAALVLGKLGDRRAVPSLMQALKDANETVRGVAATSLGRLGDNVAANALLSATNDSSEFVRTQAKRALELVGAGGDSIAMPGPRAGARFYLAIGFTGSSRVGSQYQQFVRQALVKELQKLPGVTLSVGGGGAPSSQALSQKRLEGLLVDGNIQRLSASPAGGASQIECDLKAFVASYPGKSIRMMTTEGASLQAGSGPAEGESAKRDCLGAAVEQVREDVGKYLRTLQ
jgi:hypothetical protein